MPTCSRRRFLHGSLAAIATLATFPLAGRDDDIEPIRPSLHALAELAPQRTGNLSGEGFPITSFADLALARTFVNAEATSADLKDALPHLDTIIPSVLTWELAPRGWTGLFGIDPEEIDAALAQPVGNDTLHLLKGRFDVAAVKARWMENGYGETEDGSRVWTFPGTDDAWNAMLDRVGLTSSLARASRTLALPYDDVVAFGDANVLARTVAVTRKDDKDMTYDGPPRRFVRTDIEGVGEAVMIPAKVMFAPGITIPASSPTNQRTDATAIPEDVARSWVRGAMMATTPGAPYALESPMPLPSDPATYVVVVDLTDDADAQTYLNQTVSQFEQQQSVVWKEPLSTFLDLQSAEVEPIGTVRLTFRQRGEKRYDLIDMLNAYDLSFLAYPGNGSP
ncbi:MAG: hypothetical protein QM589_17795 [Thermomicrobiales bacterium]